MRKVDRLLVDIWAAAELIEYTVSRDGDAAMHAEVLPQIVKIKATEKELESEVDALHDAAAFRQG